ncbi:MAG: NUDIX domain-containing protein [Gammaproteobacteria bacterium]|nr:NUDIX domain-containing protein [Gammaproteobacteria bacterium]
MGFSWRRRASGRDAGLWEFPGGKVDRGETPTAALVRELREELALEECVVGEAVATARDSRIALTAYWIDTWIGVPRATVHDAIQWVTAAELALLAMPEVDLRLIGAVTTDYKRHMAGTDRVAIRPDNCGGVTDESSDVGGPS